jgi:hypothetical protein
MLECRRGGAADLPRAADHDRALHPGSAMAER